MKLIVIAFITTLFVVNVHAQQTGQSKDSIYNLTSLDIQPKFKGGSIQKEVMKYFRMPDIDVDLNATIYVNFIIEKDGTMSNIKCSRDPGHGLGKAAEDALASVTTKWEPGYNSKGFTVRTIFTLPIRVILQSTYTPPTPAKGN